MSQGATIQAAAQSFGVTAPVGATRSERVRAILPEVRGPNVLHIGCVNHQLPTTAPDLRDHLHYQLCVTHPDLRIVGLDLEAAGVEQLRRAGFEAVQGDAQDLPYHAEFDTIVAGELIEHLSNPGMFLASCARALKPGGRLVLSTPNIFTPILFLMYCKNNEEAFNREHSQW